MSLNLNSVTVAGSLTRDVETRNFGEKTVADFAIAINRKFRGSDGEMKSETTYVDVSAWGRQAELCGQYLAKGRNVLIEGALSLDQWEDIQGNKRSKIKINANRVHFLGSPANKEGPSNTASAGSVSQNLGGDDYDETPF
jgi:single-strand DNA-binding protein